VVDLLEKRSDDYDYIIVDTPGQIQRYGCWNHQ
jgi:cellulose biosynthesis protein BcsQ